MGDEGLVVRRRVGGVGGRKRYKVNGVPPVIAGEKSCFFEVAGLERGSAGVFVLVLVARRRGRTVEGITIKAKILRAEALAGLFVRPQIHDCLPAPLDGHIRRVIGVEAQASVVEVVARAERRAPIDDPAAFRAKTVVDFLLGLANVDAVDETRNADEARSDVAVGSVVGEVKAVAAQLGTFGGAGVVVSVAAIAGAEGVEILFAVQVEVAGTGDGLAVERPVLMELQMGVGAAEAIEFSARGTLPIGVEEANIRLAEDITAHPGDGEVRAHVGEYAVVGHGEAGAAIVRGHDADRVRAVFSGETDSSRGIANVAGEE